MRSTDVAWAAGLYEGEGSLSILWRRGRPKLQFCLGTTDLDVLERFVAIVGIGIIRGPYQRARRKPCWQWGAHGFDTAGYLFDLFEPYLGDRRRIRFIEALGTQLPRPQNAAKNRKLTDAEANIVRARLTNGETQAHLGREFGVTPAQIWRIKNRITYIVPSNSDQGDTAHTL